jgi:hypothetical protein
MMKRLVAATFALSLSLTAVPALSAADAPKPQPGADAELSRDLVRLLASEDFAVRENATRRLAALGKSAESVLKEGVLSDDSEVRRRCAELLAVATRSDLETVLAEFLVDRDEKVLRKLPAFPRFVKAVGDDPQARSLFIEMCMAEPVLMNDLEQNPQAAAAALAARCQQYQQRLRFGPQSMPLGEAAAMLYAAGDERINLELINLHMMCSSLYHPDVKAHFEHNAAARKLLLHFLEHRHEPAFAYQKLNVVQIHNLKEALPWLIKTANDKTQQPHVRGQSLAIVARLGSAKEIADLEPLLSDESQLGQFQFNTVRVTTQMRDVALGVLVILSKQNLQDYEIPYFVQFPQVLNQQNPNGFYLPYQCLGYADDAARQKALKKWKDSTAGKK